MNTRTLLALTCSASALLAGSAAGQNRDQHATDPQRPTPGRSNPDQSRSAASAPDLLRDMQGTYRVDIRINPVNWHMGMKGEKINPANAQRTDAKDTASGMKTCSGYAVSDLIMNGNVLRQSFVSNDMSETSMRDRSTTAAPGDRDLSGMNIGQDAFRGLSYLAFDRDTNTYSCVFMDSMGGNMHMSSGSYDESGRQIVLKPSGDQSGNPGRTNASNQSGQTRGTSGKRVVVEILGSDSYRVTMYKHGATDMSTTGSNAGKSGTDRSTAADTANIVYTATYTRASGDDLPGINRLLSHDTQLWPDSTRRDGVDGMNSSDPNNRGWGPDNSRDPNRDPTRDDRTTPMTPSNPTNNNPR